MLVDTSVWVSHLRETHAGLVDPLNDGSLVCHRFIVGEFAYGNLKLLIQHRSKLVPNFRHPALDLNEYLRKWASRFDLIGDIDGINIGSVYDDSRSLAENLRAY